MTEDPRFSNTSKQGGSEDQHSEPRFLVIGQVTRPHGVKGEVRVMPHTDLPERFKWLEVVFVGDASPRPVNVQGARLHKDWIILKLAGYDSREQAEQLRGQLLQVSEEQALPLDVDQYFLYQLLELDVATTDGKVLGTLIEVIETGANNVFVVRGDQGELLIPDIPEVIQDIDFDQNRMIINPLPGLLKA